MKRILIVDDEMGTRESLKAIFSGTYETILAENAALALERLSGERVDLILLDIMMPDKDGLTLLGEIQHMYPDVPVIMVTALTSVRPVVEAMREGAYDYIAKPFDVEEVRVTVNRALESSSLQRRVQVLETEISREFPLQHIVGRSPSFLRAIEDAHKAADTDSTVLIHGESGTGKELLARLLHDLSSRRDEPFVPVHCAALPESLMESELFGYEKGAFTNAERQKLGRFDLAASGTLFFDEVSEMSMSTQVKLLRVLQEREFMRIGGTRIVRTNARIIAASAKNLKDEVKAGRFRDDLFYRLSVVPIELPPLRARDGDMVLLARHFLAYFKQTMDVMTEDFDEETLDILQGYLWPGNVRELRNIVERMLVLHGQDRYIRPDYLPSEIQQPGITVDLPATSTHSLEHAVNEFERKMVIDALKKAKGVQTHAADILGTTRRILRYRMDKLNIESQNFQE